MRISRDYAISEEMSERRFEIRDASVADIPIIMQLIRDLAKYERAPNDVIATEQDLREVLFGAEPAAKVVIALENAVPVGFAVYFSQFFHLARSSRTLSRRFVCKAGNARARATGARCSSIWRKLRAITIADEWNGRC